MVKIPRKVGIAIALTSLLLFGGCAYGISKIKFAEIKSEIKSNVAPFQEIGGVLLNEKLADEFLNFEYQLLLGEYYSNNDEYEKAMSCYEKAIQSAKATLGEKSFFTYVVYNFKAHAEEKYKHPEEAHEDFKAALSALPDREEFDTSRCLTENWLIYTGDYRNRKEYIPFYQKHLNLTEKLTISSDDHDQLVSALWHLGSALDDGQRFSESEPIWVRMMSEVRRANYPRRKFESYLLSFANHEMYAGHYIQSESALTEALKISAQISNSALAGAFEAKGDLYLRENNLSKAENAFQACLELRKATEDKISLSWAYDCLSEVARRRDDSAKREEYLKSAMQLMDDATGKADYLATLAFIAAQNKRAPQAKEYFQQWKELIKKNEVRKTTFVLEDDLKKLLVLYPQLKKPKKASPSESVDFDLKKLESDDIRFHQKGYSLSAQQVARLMNVATLNDRLILKK